MKLTDLMTPRDAAIEIGCSSQWVRILRKSGKLRAVLVGHVHMLVRADVEKYARMEMDVGRPREGYKGR